ncbi:MAG: hypothetical protein KAU10_09265, partial [Dehalococcoidia bacterium]|nr:hypothetical protein [Dehalococcoidia bacterium]
VTDILYLTPTQTGSYNQVNVKGEADGIAWEAAAKFEMWCWCFLEAKLEASWEWVECGISMSTSTYYTKDIGFGYFALSMEGITLLQEEDISIQPLVDLEFRFTTDTKALTPTLRLEATQWWGCPECYVLGELVWTGTPFSMAGLSVYGMVCQLEFDNEVTATFADSFIDAKNSAVTGFAEFFELWQFAGLLVPCCGSPGSWEVSVYFLDHPVPTPLFGWGMTSLVLDTPLSEQVSISLNIEFRPGSPHWKFTLGLKTLW